MSTPARVVALAPAGDDAGARTADLYDWQAAMATADGLKMYVDALDNNGRIPPDVADHVICEHHEDWTLIRSPDAELVSAKHRELSSGAFTTIRQLVDKGGLAHLLGRWLYLDRMPGVRLVTCAALAAGDPRKLGDATRQLRDEAAGRPLEGETLASIDRVTNLFTKEVLLHRNGLPAEWQMAKSERDVSDSLIAQRQATVRQFLSRLVIDEGRPHRDIVGYAAPTMYALPVVQKLRQSEAAAVAVWQAVLVIFRSRMRARDEDLRGALPTILAVTPAAGGATTDHELAKSIESRKVTLRDVDVAIRVALRNPLGFMPIALPLLPTRLSVKMARGGCSDNSISRAERLRADFRRYRRERGQAPPGAIAEWRAIERKLMRIADEATDVARTPTGTWGASFWSELCRRLDSAAIAEWGDGLDEELGLGGICDLSARCEVWFSSWFDVKAEVSRLLAERGA